MSGCDRGGATGGRFVIPGQPEVDPARKRCRTTTRSFDFDGPAGKVTVALGQTQEVLRPNVQAQVGTYQPSTAGQQYGTTLPGPGTQPSGIDTARYEPGTDDHDVERIDQSGDHRCHLILRRAVDDNEPFESDTMLTRRGQPQIGRTDHRDPRALRGCFPEQGEHESGARCLDHRPALDPSPGEQWQEIGADRQYLILGQGQLLYMTTTLQRRQCRGGLLHVGTIPNICSPANRAIQMIGSEGVGGRG